MTQALLVAKNKPSLMITKRRLRENQEKEKKTTRV